MTRLPSLDKLRTSRRFFQSLLALTFFGLGCARLTLTTTPVPTPSPEPTLTTSPLPAPSETAPPTSTFIPTQTLIPSATPSATFTFTPSSTFTPEFILRGPGEIFVPILLYHHIGFSQKASPYYISPEEFDRQMALLYQWGYRTISVELLVKAIQQGAQLPARPIILTFDDGSESVYTEALPIMQMRGFTGTAYIVTNYIGASLYMDRDQIRALYASGWEIGSHSLSHVNLRQHPGVQEEEIVSSRHRLESYLDLPILSFAYPFGANDSDSLKLVKDAGYIAAVGLGADIRQSQENIFYLYRREIKSSYDLSTFSQFLPWQGGSDIPTAVTMIP